MGSHMLFQFSKHYPLGLLSYQYNLKSRYTSSHLNSNGLKAREGDMVHSLAPRAAATATPTSTTISTRTKKAPLPSIKFQRLNGAQGLNQALDHRPIAQSINRRGLIWGLTGAILGLNADNLNLTANAARRPPPPPPEEKKDPNVSGVQAKVLASKKRKEAMKESVAKLREKGKPINQPSE